ncbi:MAG: malto-oligosyltrehalose synthase, partial [Steroidobacteraceae bacterium]
ELHRLLESQAYRLAYWRVASDEVNYRRFFDVNDLAALRMENESVFEATHRLVFELLAQGLIDGLRIDHPDGLYDPAQYFERLQSRAAALAPPVAAADAAAAVRAQSRPRVRSSKADLPLYLVVEKITAAFEHLPRAWPVHGTTGYRFANVVNGLLIDGRSRARFDRIYRAFSGDSRDWGTIAYESKRLIIETSLASELNVLAQALTRIARASRRTRDLTLHSLKSALAEIIACFPVYRTYSIASASSEDRRYIEWAVAAARRRGAAVDTAVYDFTRGVLLGEGASADPAIGAAARAFTMKFQQVTAPAVAKGVEDTALYRFDRLVAVNEVGGDPEIFGVSVRAFHADAQRRAREWPHELNATSTHDTKRSEDVRARIGVLTEMPADWRRSLVRWSRMNRARRREMDGAPAPSRTDEYLLYQTLIGTLPLEAAMGGPADTPRANLALSDDYRGRIEAYMIKAAREAKSRSSWSSIDRAYEAALVEFIRGALEPRPGNLFLPDIVALTSRIAHAGLLNALTQTLCKLTTPGIPDLYQGTELWDFSLVDPDNRRAVDYELRRRRLAELEGLRSLPRSELAGHARGLAESLADGRAKLFVIWRALQCRRAAEDLYTHGEYLPLAASGARAAHLCAFARRRGTEVAITIAPRLYLTLARECAGVPLGEPAWGDTHIELPEELPTGMLDSVFDGARVRAQECGARRVLLAKEVLASFPVALLTGTLAQQQPPPP